MTVLTSNQPANIKAVKFGGPHTFDKKRELFVIYALYKNVVHPLYDIFSAKTTSNFLYFRPSNRVLHIQ